MEVFRALQAPMRIIMRSDGSTASQLRDVFVSESDIRRLRNGVLTRGGDESVRAGCAAEDHGIGKSLAAPATG